MCLIIFKPFDKALTKEDIDIICRAYNSNYDGFGIMTKTGYFNGIDRTKFLKNYLKDEKLEIPEKEIFFEKKLLNLDNKKNNAEILKNFLETINKTPKFLSEDVGIHLRNSTGERIDDINSHPYVCSNKYDYTVCKAIVTKKGLFMHNGIFNNHLYNTDEKKMSDSYYIANIYFNFSDTLIEHLNKYTKFSQNFIKNISDKLNLRYNKILYFHPKLITPLMLGNFIKKNDCFYSNNYNFSNYSKSVNFPNFVSNIESEKKHEIKKNILLNSNIKTTNLDYKKFINNLENSPKKILKNIKDFVMESDLFGFEEFVYSNINSKISDEMYEEERSSVQFIKFLDPKNPKLYLYLNHKDILEILGSSNFIKIDLFSKLLYSSLKNDNLKCLEKAVFQYNRGISKYLNKAILDIYSTDTFVTLVKDISSESYDLDYFDIYKNKTFHNQTDSKSIHFQESLKNYKKGDLLYLAYNISNPSYLNKNNSCNFILCNVSNFYRKKELEFFKFNSVYDLLKCTIPLNYFSLMFNKEKNNEEYLLKFYDIFSNKNTSINDSYNDFEILFKMINHVNILNRNNKEDNEYLKKAIIDTYFWDNNLKNQVNNKIDNFLKRVATKNLKNSEIQIMLNEPSTLKKNKVKIKNFTLKDLFDLNNENKNTKHKFSL